MSSRAGLTSDDYDVYLGIWTNWSHGKIKGATITLTRQNGSLLIAFVALFVGAAGRALWRIVCFALHTLLSSNLPQDGLYHQTQAILRNSETAGQGAWQLLKTMLVWSRKKTASQPIRRVAPHIALGVVMLVSSTVAGLFSSRISTDGLNEVLLNGDNCGILGRVPGNAKYSLIPLDGLGDVSYGSQRTKNSINYALQCYNNQSIERTCGPYLKQRLNLSVAQPASCPFEKDICQSQHGSLLLDTGFLNSHDDLGINDPPSDRFLFRSVHHCAPLKTSGFSNIYNVTGSVHPASVQRLYYGRLLWGDLGADDNNYTYQQPLNNFYSELNNLLGPISPISNYQVDSMAAYSGSTSEAKLNTVFRPIPHLQHSNADVFLFFLSAQTVWFMNEVEDPWFAAHIPGPRIHNAINDKVPVYLKDEAVTTIGCTVQTQFCNPNTPESEPPRCGELNGQLDDKQLDRLSFGPHQEKMHWVNDVFINHYERLCMIVRNANSDALLAKRKLEYKFQATLPANQWQSEVEHWVNTGLAALQGAFIEVARGSPSPQLAKYWTRPQQNETGALHICKSQKIRSTRFSSFSVLGICLILIIGALMMVLDPLLEPIVRWCQIGRSTKTRTTDAGLEDAILTEDEGGRIGGKRQVSNLYKRHEWNATSTLQLQRLAHEAIGCGTWSRTTAETPITLPGQTLGILQLGLGQKKHPRLVNPDVAEDSESSITAWSGDPDSIGLELYEIASVNGFIEDDEDRPPRTAWAHQRARALP